MFYNIFFLLMVFSEITQLKYFQMMISEFTLQNQNIFPSTIAHFDFPIDFGQLYMKIIFKNFFLKARHEL